MKTNKKLDISTICKNIVKQFMAVTLLLLLFARGGLNPKFTSTLGFKRKITNQNRNGLRWCDW